MHLIIQLANTWRKNWQKGEIDKTITIIIIVALHTAQEITELDKMSITILVIWMVLSSVFIFLHLPDTTIADVTLF